MKFLADENFNATILRGVRRQVPTVDIVTIQDLDLRGLPDPEVLERAATDGRILLTQDVETMLGFARERIAAGFPTPGVVVVSQSISLAVAIRELEMMAECGHPDDFANRILHVPL